MARVSLRRSQGPALGRLLFNIYLNDLLYLSESTEICNFADDTRFIACDKGLNSLIKRLEYDSSLVTEFFENNNKKLNQDKCYLLISGIKYEFFWAKTGDEIICESNN